MVMTSSQGTMSAARFRSRWRRREFASGGHSLHFVSLPPVCSQRHGASQIEPALLWHELGHLSCDQLGRDVHAVHGSHIDPAVAIRNFLGLVIGAIVGLFGHVRGWIDEILQRVLEAIISIPSWSWR
jgi:ABC-type dipeptide/oligopeptide/nickel transport system permease subunit